MLGRIIKICLSLFLLIFATTRSAIVDPSENNDGEDYVIGEVNDRNVINDEETSVTTTSKISKPVDLVDLDEEGDGGYFNETNRATGGYYGAGTEDEITAEERAYAKCGRRGVLPSAFSEEAQAEEQAWEQAEFVDERGQEPLVRIIAGRITTPEEYPWQVSIHKNGRHICGGSIVGKRYIVSAAHCFKTRDRRVYKIYAAKSSKVAGELGELGPYYIEGAVVHGKHGKDSPLDSDIALVKLTKPIKYTRQSYPVCLPPQDYVIPSSRRCYVSGYGQVKETGGEGLLKTARVSILSEEQCKRMTQPWSRNLLTKNMVCAGGMVVDDGTSCKGDSGGPLVCETKHGSNTYALQGIVSFGKSNCGDHKYTPTVYTRVARFYTWARKNFERLQQYRPEPQEEYGAQDEQQADDEE